MRFPSLVLLSLVLSATALTLAQTTPQSTPQSTLVPLAKLDQVAKAKTTAQPRVALAAETAEIFAGLDALESGRVPNYLRALAALPKAVKPFAQLIKTFNYSGTVAPETKLAMGVRVAQVYGSAYPALHFQRLLRSTERGQKLLASLQANDLTRLSASEQAALRYAELLTRDVHGVSDAEFERTRASFNDSQVVELTMVVAFCNYFTRFCEALNLPVEQWALAEPVAKASLPRYVAPPARVALISDEEMRAVADATAARNAGGANPNSFGLVNSQRAFMRVPALQRAWRDYGAATRDYAQVSREIKLHVSFAVSMLNGCRYCTLHQVQGLRRLGVEPAKLMAMRKDDAQLTTRELAAVKFARKLTAQPTAINDGDYAALRQEFGEQGALEVLLQTCNFAFMNRFTDGLRLPSEDEAIRIYRETYGGDFVANKQR